MSSSDSNGEHDHLRILIRDVPDFPSPGIIFKDITPLLNDSRAFHSSVEAMTSPYENGAITVIAGIESRGFIFGAAASNRLGCRFIPVRKPGKLPWRTNREEYELEYGTDALELHTDALSEEDRVLIVDDLLATGGTLAATRALVDRSGATIVGASVLIELDFLQGRQKLSEMEVHSILRY
ncbi:MAG: adenine phosphoribosyltransferase [Thermoanaerobaculia bacterium]|nr:adenine phosphoribosyltransferase [Thermoanaerobaculia bacterium]